MYSCRSLVFATLILWLTIIAVEILLLLARRLHPIIYLILQVTRLATWILAFAIALHNDIGADQTFSEFPGSTSSDDVYLVNPIFPGNIDEYVAYGVLCMYSLQI